jgi:sugar phosphate isomerase/epimerase
MQILLNTIMVEPNRWSDDKTPHRPLCELLPALGEAGFSALEIWQYHASSLDARGISRLAGDLRAHAQEAVGLGAYPFLHLEGPEGDEATTRLGRLVAYAANLGVTTFKIFPGRVPSSQADDATWARSILQLRGLAQQLAARGMTLTLETHGNTLCDTAESTARVLADIGDLDNIGICFQPYTDQNTDAAIAFYEMLTPHVRHVHLQNRSSTTGGACCLLEDGDWLDYKRLLPAIKNSGFDGPLSLEFTAAMPTPQNADIPLQKVLENAAKDRDFVREIWDS